MLMKLAGTCHTAADGIVGAPTHRFNHQWDAHGGGAYLHEHLIDEYISCWQQGLANGETDASVCDHGTSRWFNYYLEGAFWSISQAPHMDGIYQNKFDRDPRGIFLVFRVESDKTTFPRVMKCSPEPMMEAGISRPKEACAVSATRQETPSGTEGGTGPPFMISTKERA